MIKKWVVISIVLSFISPAIENKISPLHLGTAAAQVDKSFDREDSPKEDQKEWDATGAVNIFLGTDKILYKAGAFLVLSIMSFMSSWLLFRFFIKKNKSPARYFTVCFSMFMLSLYLIGFFCFSEYALDRTHDPAVSYLSQLNRPLLLMFLLGWIPVSFGGTLFLRGKA